MLQMFSTLKNITSEIPVLGESSVTHRYLLYPQKAGKRAGEGGLRTAGKYKRGTIDQPLVTIITVCLNSADTLEQSLQSVLQQTYGNIEYIVIDGGSTDGTLDLIRKYNRALDYYVSEADEGLYHAMNKGLELATGDFILILNSDDWYETECVARLMRGLQASGLDFCSALARRVDQNGKELNILQSMPFDDSLRFGMSLRHELMFVSAEIYNTIGYYDTSYRIISDFEFALRLFNAGYRCYEIQIPLLNFRVTGISHSNWDKLINEHFILLQSQFKTVKKKTLLKLSDTRKYTAELVDQALLCNSSEVKFVDSLIAYGYRRSIYNITRQPALKPEAHPMVSIIVPAYNAADTIDRTLTSILSQSLREVEVICIDDFSLDNTAHLICQYLACDSRVRLIRNVHNYGVAASRNIALNKSNGRYVFFVDADDELLPNALASLVTIAEKQYYDIVRGAYEKVIDNGRLRVTGRPPNNGVDLTTLRQTPELLKSTEGFWACLYRNSFIRNTKFSENLKLGEDSLFFISAIVQAKRIAWIPDVVYRYHIHSNSSMRNLDLHKYLNSIEWRERAWQIFYDYGFANLANWCAFDYWNPAYFTDMTNLFDANQIQQIQNRLKIMLKVTNYRPGACHTAGFAAKVFDHLYQK